jgi:hypothetical protein
MLVTILTDTVMRWLIGREPTYISVEHDLYETVDLGICHLQQVDLDSSFQNQVHHPAYISEPLVVLCLASLFSKHLWTSSHNRSEIGTLFEEVIMFVLMEKFGGEPTALSDVLHLPHSSSLAGRKVGLVSLSRSDEGSMKCCEVSWTKGTTDRLGVKTCKPEDVLTFLGNPDGKVFLFPGNYMGPDLICFVKDHETDELILLALQCKVAPDLNSGQWLKAIMSVTPNFFYTVQVSDPYILWPQPFSWLLQAG